MIVQVFLWTIVLISAFISYEFYKSRDGRLRVIIIELFLAKMVVYGGGALMLLGWLKFIPYDICRILINLPMLLVMLRLYMFIRLKK